jgi:hypothetical protein
MMEGSLLISCPSRCEMKNPLATIPFQLNKLSILCGYHIDLLQLKSGISDPGFTVVGCSDYYSLGLSTVSSVHDGSACN